MRGSQTGGRDKGPTYPRDDHDRRRSEAGDTLVEILIALTIVGIAATAILLAFATAISGSGNHRNEVTLDTMLRAASEEATGLIQQQSFSNCSGAYLYASPGSIPLSNPAYSAYVSSVQYESANPADSATDTYNWSSPAPPTTSCPSGDTHYADSPQQLTVSVTYTSSSTPPTTSTIQTVVDDPNSPPPAATCQYPPSQLVFLEQPIDDPSGSAGSAGSALYPPTVVAVQDKTGCTEQNDFSAVKLSITAGTGTSGASLQDCAPSQQYGETIFTGCAINEPGTNYTLTASDPTDGLTPIVSNPFNVLAGVPAQLVFTTQPGNGTGGTPLTQQPVVYIEDAQGNLVTTDNTTVTLAIGSNPGHGTLSGCTAQTSGGIATFTGCTIDKIGTGYTLTATDAADLLTTPSAPSGPFNITPGQPYRLAFTTTPGTAVAGDRFANQPVVTLLDAGGNTATVAPGSTDAVGIAIGTNPGGGTLSGCTETTTAGVGNFGGCSINTPGSGYTLVATDTTNPAVLSATSGPFNVVAPVLTSFQVSNPGTQVAGTSFRVTITALDQSGNQFTGYTGSQTLSFTGPSPSPDLNQPSYPPGGVVNFLNGVGTAGTSGTGSSIVLYDASTTTNLTISQGSVSGSTGNFTVSPLTAKTLTVSGFPNPTAAGTAGSVTVTADDIYGNVATGYRGTIKFTSSDTKAGLPPNYTFTVASAGNHTFTNGVTLNTVGTQSITATDTATGTITGTQGPITVTKASPTISTALSAGTIAIGGSAHDTSTLSGAVNSTGTATVTYSYYTNNTCTTGPVSVNTVTVATNGTVPNSSTVTFNSAGSYYWQAVYSGDANNNGASSPCTATNNEQLTVNKASPTISTTLSASSISPGFTAYDTSTLSGAVNSSGIAGVTYSYYTNNTCTTGQVIVGTVTVATNGTVPNSPAATFNSTGTYYWQAVYSGDANNNGASSPCTATNNEQLTVKYSPTISTSLSAGTIAAGTGVHDTSTLSGAVNSTGTATVTYSYYTNNTCTTGQVNLAPVTVATNGTVPNSSTVTFISAGTYYWQAVYSGDANNYGASSPCTSLNNEQLTVTKASPTIGTTLSAGTIAIGGTAHDTSTLSGAVNSTGTATVTYSYYTNNTCTAGQVSLAPVTVATNGTVPNSSTVTFNSAGSYYWQAVYSGDANNNGASSPCTATNNEQLTVTKASPTISTALSAGTIAIGGSAHDTSTLSGAVNSTGTATVTYSYYTNNTCTTGPVSVNTVTVATNGTVPNSSTVTFNSAGSYYWQAVYSGDANNNGASSPCTATNNEQLTVNKASPTISTTLSASSISPGFTAYDTSTLSGAVNSSGIAGVTYSYYTNNTCTAGQVSVGTVTVATNGTVPNSPAPHLQQYRHLLLAGGLQRRRQQQRCVEPLHGDEQRAAHGEVQPDHQHGLVGRDHHRRHRGPRHLDAERGRELDRDGHGHLQLLHQQHLHDRPGEPGPGDGGDQRHGAQLEHRHLHHRRQLLLAGGLQRRRQQLRCVEPLHVAQ